MHPNETVHIKVHGGSVQVSVSDIECSRLFVNQWTSIDDFRSSVEVLSE